MRHKRRIHLEKRVNDVVKRTSTPSPKRELGHFTAGSWSRSVGRRRFEMRLFLLWLLTGLATAECGPTLMEGDALGSDSVVHASIDGHSTEAARSAPPGFETAGGTSQRQAGGASRNMLGVPTDVQRKICLLYTSPSPRD